MLVEGKIKCTYVELFDVSGRKLFSLQKKDVGNINAFMTDQTFPKGYVRVRLSDKALATIFVKLQNDERRMSLVEYLNENGVYVRADAVQWNYGLLLLMAIGLGVAIS